MNLTQHPFMSSSFGGIESFPAQTVSKKEKEKESWYKPMLDNFEAIGRFQQRENLLLEENCLMAKGVYIPHHYEDVEDEAYVGLIEDVQKNFKTPKKLQHFDTIQPVIETLLGELDSHPDTFRAVAKGETVSNAMEREKGEMLMEYVMENINNDINAKLLKSGLDPNKKDFTSEEEATQYGQQIDEARKALTPSEIKYFFDNKWQHIAEKWANIQLEDDKEKHDLTMKTRHEFEMFLKTGKCARHFYLTSTGYKQETWDYKQLFYHKSPDVLYPENGNYIGRTTLISFSDVIDRFHNVLTQEDLDDLDDKNNSIKSDGYVKDWFGNDIKHTSVDGLPMGVRIPTNNDIIYNLWPKAKDTLNSLSYLGNYSNGYLNNLYQLTEVYWKSQKKISRLRWINPETGEDETILVDESFVKPPFIKEIKGTLFNKNPEIDTLESTYINVIYQGKKLTPLGNTITTPKYFDIKECDFQNKSETSIYEPAFPVVMLNDDIPLVSKMKPFQIFHNLFLNQLRLIAEEEILPYMAFDVNTIPKDKDWGGVEGFSKYMEAIKSLRMAPMDTRPHITNGANSGGQLPMIVDMDVTARMQSRLELAQAMKAMALEQVGFNPQRLAQIQASETATGVNQAMQGSYAQTSSIFTKFYNYVKRTLQTNLNFAQYTQATETDINVFATKSDRTQAWLKLNGTDLLTVDLHVYVSNAQEEIRKLEFSKRMAVENNTVLTKMSDRIEMGTSNSIEYIKELLKISEEEMATQQKQAQELEQQKLAMQEKLEKSRQEFEASESQKDRDAKKEQTYIQTFGYMEDNLKDSDSNNTPDILEYNKFLQKVQTDNANLSIQEQKQAMEVKKQETANRNEQAKRDFEEKKFLMEMELQQKKLETATILGDKSK